MFYLPAPGRREEGGRRREGSFLGRRPALPLCCHEWDDPEMGHASITHPLWGHWQPPMSPSLLGGHHKQSALGWAGDRDVWDTSRRSEQFISNMAVLIGYKIILPPLSHGILIAGQSFFLSSFFLQVRPRVVE